MKTFKLSFFLFFITLLILSCSKDKNFELEGEKLNYTETLNYLQDPNDIENEIVTEIQYHFAVATHKMIKIKEFKKLIYHRIDAQKTKKQINVELLSVLEEDLEIAKMFNTFLSQSIENGIHFQNHKIETQNVASYLASKMIYQDIYYYPVLTIQNKNLIGNEKIIIGIGQEIDDDENIITFDENEIKLVNEERLSALEGLLLVVNNHTDQAIEVSSIKRKAQPQATFRNDQPIYWQRFYQVKDGYRYEVSGDTDYRTKIRMYILDESEGENGVTQSISESEVSNSTIFSTNTPIYYPPFPEFNTSVHGVNSDINFAVWTWEYDWSASHKNLTCFCSCDGTNALYLDGRRKYSSDYYSFDCGKGAEMWPNDLDDEYESNGFKSTHTIKRVDEVQ